ADALRKFRLRRAVGRLGVVIDQRASPQFVERQRRVHSSRVEEVAVDQSVEEMADVEPPLPPGSVRVTNDVDGAAVGQQIVELRPLGELVDPRQIDKQQPPGVGERGIELIEVHRLPTVNGAYTNEVTLLADHVDQLELLEHGGDRLETTAYLRPRLDRDAQWRGVVEDETHERMRHRSFAPVGHEKVQAGQV